MRLLTILLLNAMLVWFGDIVGVDGGHISMDVQRELNELEIIFGDLDIPRDDLVALATDLALKADEDDAETFLYEYFKSHLIEPELRAKFEQRLQKLHQYNAFIKRLLEKIADGKNLVDLEERLKDKSTATAAAASLLELKKEFDSKTETSLSELYEILGENLRKFNGSKELFDHLSHLFEELSTVNNDDDETVRNVNGLFETTATLASIPPPSILRLKSAESTTSKFAETEGNSEEIQSESEDETQLKLVKSTTMIPSEDKNEDAPRVWPEDLLHYTPSQETTTLVITKDQERTSSILDENEGKWTDYVDESGTLIGSSERKNKGLLHVPINKKQRTRKPYRFEFFAQQRNQPIQQTTTESYQKQNTVDDRNAADNGLQLQQQRELYDEKELEQLYSWYDDYDYDYNYNYDEYDEGDYESKIHAKNDILPSQAFRKQPHNFNGLDDVGLGDLQRLNEGDSWLLNGNNKDSIRKDSHSVPDSKNESELSTMTATTTEPIIDNNSVTMAIMTVKPPSDPIQNSTGKSGKSKLLEEDLATVLTTRPTTMSYLSPTSVSSPIPYSALSSAVDDRQEEAFESLEDALEAFKNSLKQAKIPAQQQKMEEGEREDEKQVSKKKDVESLLSLSVTNFSTTTNVSKVEVQHNSNTKSIITTRNDSETTLTSSPPTLLPLTPFTFSPLVPESSSNKIENGTKLTTAIFDVKLLNGSTIPNEPAIENLDVETVNTSIISYETTPVTGNIVSDAVIDDTMTTTESGQRQQQIDEYDLDIEDISFLLPDDNKIAVNEPPQKIDQTWLTTTAISIIDIIASATEAEHITKNATSDKNDTTNSIVLSTDEYNQQNSIPSTEASEEFRSTTKMVLSSSLSLSAADLSSIITAVNISDVPDLAMITSTKDFLPAIPPLENIASFSSESRSKEEYDDKDKGSLSSEAMLINSSEIPQISLIESYDSSTD